MDMEGQKCVFCLIASKGIESKQVYEDAMILAVLDINPATNGHVIVMPKNHYNSLYEMPQQEYLHMMSVAWAVSYALLVSRGATNVDLVYTQELSKGTFTPHPLIHAIPRYKDDTVNYVWQPQKVDDQQLEEIAAAVKDAIEKIKQESPLEPPAAPQQQKGPEAPKVEEKKEEPIELKKKIVVF